MPNSAAPVHSIARFAPVRLRSASRRSGSSGLRPRVSMTANAASSVAPPASAASTLVSPQCASPSWPPGAAADSP
jgi:hypothetical protein